MYALVTSKSLSGIFWKWKHCFAGGRITSSSLSKSKAQEEYGDLEEERNEQTNRTYCLLVFTFLFYLVPIELNIQLVSYTILLPCVGWCEPMSMKKWDEPTSSSSRVNPACMVWTCSAMESTVALWCWKAWMGALLWWILWALCLVNSGEIGWLSYLLGDI